MTRTLAPTPAAPAGDPVAAALGAVSRAYDEAAAASCWALSDHELVTDLDAAYALVTKAHLTAIRLLAEVDRRDLPAAAGAASTPAWLRHRHRLRPQQAKQDVELAALIGATDLASLDLTAITITGSDRDDSDAAATATTGRDGDAVAAAMWGGRLHLDHARVIGHALDELPPEVTPLQRRQAEQVLVGEATQHDPAALERLGHRIFEHLDPDTADARTAARLDREARNAERLRSATRYADGHGSVHYRFKIPLADDIHVWPVLDTLATPTPAADSIRDDRAPCQRLADAFVESCRRVSLDGGLPTSGGDRPRALITVDLDHLTTGTGHGTLVDTGDQLSPTALRRLCCDADVIPAVLNTTGVPLDVGRTARCFSGGLRLAVTARDQGCVHPGCERPPRWCDVHHVKPWWAGGDTSLDNGVLLCGYHHTLYDHDPRHGRPGWQIRLAPDGIPETIPPAWIDPHRQPIRHHRYLLRTRPPPLE